MGRADGKHLLLKSVALRQLLKCPVSFLSLELALAVKIDYSGVPPQWGTNWEGGRMTAGCEVQWSFLYFCFAHDMQSPTVDRYIIILQLYKF